MRIIPSWLQEFVETKIDLRQLAADLTLAGIAVESIAEQDGEPVFEMDFTTNRVDAMSHYGVARECSAIYDIGLRPIVPKLPAAHADTDFSIQIKEPELCPRYTARLIRNTKIAPCPKKIAERLTKMGSHPINNAADASNYAMMELGHPTHVFDLDLLEGATIMIRKARRGERIKTLDGIERQLHPDDLVIADATKPVAIAGVIGGWDSMITEKTKNVLIESAWFDPAAVRRTARRHGIHTDASHRFERGADYAATTLACDRVAELILLSAGGDLRGGQIDAIGRKLKEVTVHLSNAEMLRILGQSVSDAEVRRILSRLGFSLMAESHPTRASSTRRAAGTGGAGAAIAEEPGIWSVGIPTWRTDVTRDIDVVEEVARIYGYNRFNNTLPAFVGAVVENPDEQKEERLRCLLFALGYNEAISSTFLSTDDAKSFGVAETRPVALENPLSEEASVLRSSLVPGMLEMIAHNLNRGTNSLRLSETGHVFRKNGNDVDEQRQLCLGLTGNAMEAAVHAPPRAFQFFDIKGDVEELLSKFELQALGFQSGAPAYYHPGRSARIVTDGLTLGYVGQLLPRVGFDRKLKQDVYLAEILVEQLFLYDLKKPRYRKLSRFPAVQRDFSFFFDNTVSWQKIEHSVAALRMHELRSFSPREIFRGGLVPPGKYSVLLRATFQSFERTLNDEEVNLWSNQIIKQLQGMGGQLRTQ